LSWQDAVDAIGEHTRRRYRRMHASMTEHGPHGTAAVSRTASDDEHGHVLVQRRGQADSV
jgi:hypothetical protein